MANNTNTKQCPYCMETIPVNSTTCSYCGENVSSVMPAQQQGVNNNGQTMACPFCGEQIPSGSTYCPYCGEYLNAQSQPSLPQNAEPLQVSQDTPVYNESQPTDEDNRPGFFEHYFYDVFIRHYSDFSSKISLKQYWLGVVAFYLVIMFLFFFACIFVTSAEAFAGLTVLLCVLFLAFVVPLIGMEVRRLHDIGKSGAWFFIRLIPAIGGIWALILNCTPGETHCRETHFNALDWLLLALIVLGVIAGCLNLGYGIQSMY